MQAMAGPATERHRAPMDSDSYVLTFDVTMRDELALKVMREAKRLNRRPVDLVADVIERVFNDALVSAVLDE